MASTESPPTSNNAPPRSQSSPNVVWWMVFPLVLILIGTLVLIMLARTGTPMLNTEF